MKNERRSTITDKYYVTKDSCYVNIFECQQCGKQNIYDYFKYCPDCGCKIYWRLKKEYN